MNSTVDLTEPQRREIFHSLVEAQDRGLGVERSRREVAAQYGVSVVDVKQIEVEGLDNEWPPLRAEHVLVPRSFTARNDTLPPDEAKRRYPALAFGCRFCTSFASLTAPSSCSAISMQASPRARNSSAVFCHSFRLISDLRSCSRSSTNIVVSRS
jgi:hypothetical protein